ncbi:hypothetical protein [Gelidibacter pelagius]|uniref:Uncharacterized protein n=1 Tax=Gelidibacter pelagius TaxID=2819985 RepID=A0ABS3SVK7_9FLAO|nr:hypothetical protein [Gelidibacter pelagius]MBO3099763.1 hypothetical protein [Gelidibacter pelagius]
MKHLSLLLLLLIFSCNHEKTVLLPEIDHADITEVLDISPIYIFYDETKADSLELNRNNVISTTNWLVNIDKRLTLGQVIPKVILLQDKKRNAEVHKNENSKNYFTCNDTSIQNLGFLDFTHIIYKMNSILPNVSSDYYNSKEKRLILDFKAPNDIKFVTLYNDSIIKKSTLKTLKNDLDSLPNGTEYDLVLSINDQLTFQDYITFKSTLSKIESPNVTINENEFIY